MATLAERGINPNVVNDQVGRLTFTADLADGIHHLLTIRPAYGTYNLTGSGETSSWADIARDVFQLSGHDPNRVTGVTTTEYFSGAPGPIAPRPRNSVLDLTKIQATDFHSSDASESLGHYLSTIV